MIRASDIPAQGPVKYLWHDRFPVGAVSVIAGIEGTGKSTLTAAIGAGVSKSAGVIFSNEEDPRRLSRSRIEVAGGKLANVYMPEEPYVFPSAADQFAADIVKHKIKLAIFDAAAQHLPHLGSETAVRRALMPVAELAEEYGVAVIFVAHSLRSARRGMDIRQCIQGPALTRSARCLAIFGQRQSSIPGLTMRNSDLYAIAFVKDSYREAPSGLFLRRESAKLKSTTVSRMLVDGEAVRLDPFQLLAMPEGRRAAA